LMVFGFADSEAVGAVGAGGGGGGGGATFLWHALRNMIVPRANTMVAHLVVVGLVTLACFNGSSCFCAPALWRAFADLRQGALWASRKAVLCLTAYGELQSPAAAPDGAFMTSLLRHA